jgi:predicted DNA-binding transcriptional regulator AlpA
MIRQCALHEYDGLGHTQRDEKIKQGEYPPPAKLFEGGRAKAWFASEIAAYQKWRKARRDGTAPVGSTWRDYLVSAAKDDAV